jgi:hypothetical protein
VNNSEREMLDRVSYGVISVKPSGEVFGKVDGFFMVSCRYEFNLGEEIGDLKNRMKDKIHPGF